jgi:magnesium-transporting ATPase (P-type)
VLELRTTTLRADEASLTGESSTVGKMAAACEPDAPLAGRASILHASTMIASGAALALVLKTGMATEIGLIQKGVQQAAEEEVRARRARRPAAARARAQAAAAMRRVRVFGTMLVAAAAAAVRVIVVALAAAAGVAELAVSARCECDVRARRVRTHVRARSCHDVTASVMVTVTVTPAALSLPQFLRSPLHRSNIDRPSLSLTLSLSLALSCSFAFSRFRSLARFPPARRRRLRWRASSKPSATSSPG